MPTQYQPNIPTGTVNLDQDYINIRNNFTQLNTTYGTDHVAYSVPENNGYHKLVHMIPEAGIPASVAGIAQLYAKTVTSINSDTALFYLTGGNRRVQMTMNIEPVASTHGYTFLPGGILLQWGTRSGTNGSSVAVTFNVNNINFPNNCFCVNVVPIRAASSPGDNFATAVVTSSVSTTGFTIANIGAHTMAGWYWFAIGN